MMRAMRITLIGNVARERLHVPGTPGATERDGGPVTVAARTLASFGELEVTTVSSPSPSWVDLRVDDGDEPSIVTNAPIRVRGILDAQAFLLLPIAQGEFSFDQLELLAGKIALSAIGLTRVMNSRERHPLTIPERFTPLLDVLLIPWEDRHLVPEALLKEMKKQRVVILTRGDTGADAFDHGTKHSLPSIDGLPHVLAPDREACFLASFMGHYLRSREVVPAMTFAAEAVAALLRDPQGIPLPPHVRRRRKPEADAAAQDDADVSPAPLLASTGGQPQHATFERPVFNVPPPAHQPPQERPTPPPLAPGQVSMF